MGRFFIIWAIREKCVPKLNLVVGKIQFFVAIGLFPCWLSLRDLWTISVCCIFSIEPRTTSKPAGYHCPPLSPRVSSNSCPLSWWCHPIISSSVTSLSHCPQSFPESGSFPMSQLFTSSGQNIGTSAIASVLLMNIQG